eukprot:gene2452-3162_t
MKEKPNWLSMITFYWLWEFFQKSTTKKLVHDDLFELPTKRSVNYVSDNFEEIFEKQGKDISLRKAFFSFAGTEYILAGIPKLISQLLSLSQPFVLYQIINSLHENQRRSLIFTGVYFISKTIHAICDSRHRYKVSKIADMTKIALSTLIFKKYMKVSTVNEKDDENSTNLMSVMHMDVFNIQLVLRKLHDLWASLLMILLSGYLIIKMLGWASLGQLVVILLLIPINYYFQNKAQDLQKKYRKLTDKRVQILTEIINAIQLMKLFAYESLFYKKVSNSREKEINAIKDYQLQQNYLSSIWNFVPYLISLLCFSGYSLMGNKITVGQSFAVFSLLTKITEPIFLLPSFVVKIRKLSDSIENIEEFLKKEEVIPLKITKEMKEKDVDIEFENASFTWNKKEDHLKNLNLKVKSGNLVAVVGKVGSGKSSLLLSMLGEMLKTDGEVTKNEKKFSYLPQKPWMNNETVENNILFGSKKDDKKLERIIESCALLPDLNQLNDRLNTRIGERGVNLSGGQKVRVALARCCFKQDAEIFLLDDPLAAVDKGVGQHILDNVIFGELKEKTRILVTHHVHFLEKADWIVVMKDGKIFEQGTYSDLMNQISSFQTLINEFSNEKENSDTLDSGIDVQSKPIKKEEKKTKSSKKEFEGKTSYYQYASHYSFKMFLIFVGLIFLDYTSNTVSDWWLTKWSKDTDFKSNSLNYYISVYILMGILKIIISLSCSIVGVNFIIETSKSFHNDLLDKIIHAKPSFHDNTPSGKVISLFSEDVHVLDARFGNQLISLLDSICSIIISFIFMIYITPLFLIIGIPIFYLYYHLSRKSETTISEITRIHGTTYSLPFAHFKSSMNGLYTIRAFGEQNQFKNENEQLLHNHMRVVYSRTLVQEWFQIRVEFVGAIVTVASSALGILYAGDAGLLRLLLSTCMSISSKLFMFIKRSAQTQSGLLSSAIISHYIDTETEDYEGIINPSSKQWPKEGEIKLNDVIMRYKPELQPALKGIECSIKPKEKIGIVGRTGAGKSSLVYALFRLRDLDEGSIIIDDIDTKQLPVQTLRNSIGIIQQEPVLISGTLRENLDPQNVYKSDDIWETLKHVYMDSKIELMNDKLDCNVGENGKNFSRGERQLLCLARVILKRPKILFMDEATSAVDLKTDQLIQKTIRNEFKNSTVLTIAHRLQTIEDSDRILVIDKGKVSHFESPSNLSKKLPHKFDVFCEK